ncbi:N-acetylmuramoyl-L-alanine amidase [Desulfosporosinus fructosivorans]|uniref:N-acetylmuramoyl-L-alanine amidase n=1 Tax=Desulfosporosinus fructosivorans TaxID=2018669 RepID=A0A4Z0R1J1_9FIRM|nr:N-acetylmuramoyl-L-alanine amidase [Desulfosporosinus fructosivorans]TGE35857.1 N-acetylmuramoyl-L-alanine amidase [Desulfosporosinus fructosivorans]
MDKPNIKWIGSPNYSDPKGYKMIAIVDHIMAGTLIGTDSWFSNPSSGVSSHFGVGKNGDIHQYVDLRYPAWANGVANKPDWSLLKSGVNPNHYTVSIEHEGESGDVMPEKQYQATLALHRWLIETLGIPVTRDNIIGHYRIDSVNKSNCPGAGFPWDRLSKDLKGEDDVLGVAVLLNTKDDFWAGADVSVKNGNCAVFVRGEDRSVPKDAKSAEKLFVIGGATVGHPNEVLLSGNDKYDTAAAVKKYLG